MLWRVLGGLALRRLSLTFLGSGCWRSMALANLLGPGGNPESPPIRPSWVLPSERGACAASAPDPGGNACAES